MLRERNVLSGYNFLNERLTENVAPLTLTLTSTLTLTLLNFNLNLTVTLNYKNLFGKTKWRYFSGSPDIEKFSTY